MRAFLQRGAVGGDCRLQPLRPNLPLPKRAERIPEVVLGHRPVQRHPIARFFLERRAKGCDRLLQTRRSALSLSKILKGVAEVDLEICP
jgi:hypothetical protein